ncbi:ATP-dependent metalloprotease FtsH [Thermodesulfobacterium geofontis OPF15]|jgi:cell division protease FtsH|uniref:ATP-dependent zinc metalloprotease FtsH n=1 Tax=Thermodesulfobacterium geofontis (strain OPF15) TaxID=795359 RepID=F8C2P4_THEGP|nr:ATP-dependent zinc metalloprotease FtsH [Thermodesulfobacterium geofontis]AEH23445.1 ATP-dependent metalloprotease FtsH [Thermodesulfobacterium geofontis OPF15]
MKNFGKTLAIWIVISILVLVFYNFFFSEKGFYSTLNTNNVSYSEFLEKVNNNQIKEVTIEGKKIIGKLSSGDQIITYAPDDTELIPLLKQKNIKIVAKPENQNSWLTSFLISWLPFLILIVLWIVFLKQLQPSNKPFSFIKSRAKLIKEGNTKVTFNDVAGIEEVKEELQDIVEFLKNPQKFTKLGARIPKGILLVGPPGTGKTLLAKAIAGEAGVPFFSISGSDFVEMFVGVGAARVRDLFSQAKAHAPCIIFIDEIDAVGRQRGAGLGGGHDEREQTLNQLLVEMDGFDTGEGIVVLAATNRPDILDPALLRPGRFDRQVYVPPPDVNGREAILRLYAKKFKVDESIDFKAIAKGTPGFTGADLENMLNEAALIAAKKGKEKIEIEDLEEAKDKILIGKERKGIVLNEEERKIIAYHEAGHALVAYYLPDPDPVHKISIIPRGQALGVTQQLPLDDRHIYTEDYLLKKITVLLGGRVSEELVFNKVSSGAQDDLKRATQIARKMVCNWGMSKKLGPVTFGRSEEHIFLGREMFQIKDFSEETARIIDEEVKNIILSCYEKAKTILNQYLHKLHKIAQTLLEEETIDADRFKLILEGH